MTTAIEVVTCPCCWQTIEIVVDLSAGEQEYVEDCSVCCRPMLVHCITEGGELAALSVRAENE